MNHLAVKDFFTAELLDYLADELDKRAAARNLPKRWVTQASYTRHYDTTPKTVIQRTPFLRRKGAVIHEGRAMRYDITVTPNGERRT